MNDNASRAARTLTVASMVFALLSSGCTGTPTASQSHKPHGGSGSVNYYPPSAKQQGLTGRVGLVYTCDSSGRAHNIAVVDSAGSILDDGATRLVAASPCTSGDSPNAAGRIGVIFNLTNKPRVPPFEDNRPTVVVTGSALPGT